MHSAVGYLTNLVDSAVKTEPTITSHDGTQAFGSTIVFSNNTYILPSGRTKPGPPITNTSSGVKTSSRSQILPDEATLDQVSYPDTPPASLQIIDPNNQTRYIVPGMYCNKLLRCLNIDFRDS